MTKANTITYASNWLVPGIILPRGPGCNQITLTWDRTHPGTTGSCHIDPNACGLDEFGDRTICTKMAVALSDMKLTLLKEKPGHFAYTMEWRPHGSAEPYYAVPLRLVTIAAPGKELQVRLLVLKPDQTIERIIDLHKV
ncbi:MAG TPA: hypothetical protein VF516_34490 [Kofleriaceae bacterium]